MAKEYFWFEVVAGEENLLQGDFIKECPIVIPPSEIYEEIEVRIYNYNVVIMSQSCDLAQRNVKLVLVCPIWPLCEFEKKNSYYKSKDGKEALRRGYSPGYHLLNKCEVSGFEADYLVVDFRSVFSVHFDFIVNLAKSKGDRLRLLPPYREHLSQSFARFFMRVGLPLDIPPFS